MPRPLSFVLPTLLALATSACVEAVPPRDAAVDAVNERDSASAIDGASNDSGRSSDDGSVDVFSHTMDVANDSAVDAALALDVTSATDAAGADAADPCLGRAFGDRCGDGLACDGRGACAIRRPCTLESAGRWLYPDGAARRLLETVFAYGRYYNFWINPDGSYTPLNPGGNTTTSVDRWRGVGQACSTANPCSFDSFNLWASGGDPAIIETVLRGGRYFTYASAAGYRLVDSGLLEGVVRWSRAANGPCADQLEGECRFQTRSLVMDWGASQLVREEITAQGRRWVFDGAGRPVPSVPLGQRLDSVARYAASDGLGPCIAGAPCRFDAHFHDPTTGDEFVVARGRLFVWASDAENTRRYASGYGNELHTFGRYASGPCRVAR
jgi:hypothetical protein